MAATIPPLAHHLTRKRNGIYYWRRRVPGGRRGQEVALSLKTRRFREAEHLAAAADAAFEEARKVFLMELTPAGKAAAAEALNQIAAERAVAAGYGPLLAEGLIVVRHPALARAEVQPLARAPDEPVSAQPTPRCAEATPDVQTSALAAGPPPAEPAPRDGPPSHDPKEVERAVAARAASRPELATVLMVRRAAREAAERAGVLPRAKGNGLEDGPEAFRPAGTATGPAALTVTAPWTPAPAPVEPPRLPAAAAQTPKPPASSLTKEFFVGRAERGARAQVMGQDGTTLAMFFELRGDRPFAAYDRNDILEFIAALRKLPRLHGKSPHYRDLCLLEVIAEAERRKDKRLLSERTIQRHLSALRQFFMFGVNKAHITNTERCDLLGGFSFRMGKGAREQRDAWTIAELVALFTSPLYTGCRRARRWLRGPQTIRDAKFWIPLLALFHGARVEEFADLCRRDISPDEGGTWFMNIAEWEGVDGARRTLKTFAAERRVPIHPDLLRMGFLEYVQQRAPRPDSPLFPDLPRQGKDGKRSPSFVRWFGRYRKAIGVFREGVASHSFRHNVETRLRAAKADQRHLDYLLGHEPVGSEGARRYDKGPLPSESMHTLALLRYSELDLSHLYVG